MNTCRSPPSRGVPVGSFSGSRPRCDPAARRYPIGLKGHRGIGPTSDPSGGERRRMVLVIERDQLMVQRKECEFEPARDAELLENLRQVVFHRALSNRAPVGNLLVGKTSDHERHDVNLAQDGRGEVEQHDVRTVLLDQLERVEAIRGRPDDREVVLDFKQPPKRLAVNGVFADDENPRAPRANAAWLFWHDYRPENTVGRHETTMRPWSRVRQPFGLNR